MALFDSNSLKAILGYQNLRVAESQIEQEIKAGLEALWAPY